MSLVIQWTPLIKSTDNKSKRLLNPFLAVKKVNLPLDLHYAVLRLINPLSAGTKVDFLSGVHCICL